MIIAQKKYCYWNAGRKQTRFFLFSGLRNDLALYTNFDTLLYADDSVLTIYYFKLTEIVEFELRKVQI